jgi:shikimate dehydrogenase
MLKKHSIDVHRKRAVVLGTGGAAKSIVTFLEDNGVSDMYLVSREPEGVKTFDSARYQLIDYNRLTNINQADILINCTPCGMHPRVDCSPIDESLILRFGAVVDLIYNPTETLLLKYARYNNIKAVNGLYMLVAQAAAAIEIWTGQAIESSIVENVYDEIKLIFEK